jgi:hypothetical protein
MGGLDPRGFLGYDEGGVGRVLRGECCVAFVRGVCGPAVGDSCG